MEELGTRLADAMAGHAALELLWPSRWRDTLGVAPGLEALKQQTLARPIAEPGSIVCGELTLSQSRGDSVNPGYTHGHAHGTWPSFRFLQPCPVSGACRGQVAMHCLRFLMQRFPTAPQLIVAFCSSFPCRVPSPPVFSFVWPQSTDQTLTSLHVHARPD